METIECPYCEADVRVEDDGTGETEFDQECPECKKPFTVIVEYWPSYEAKKNE